MLIGLVQVISAQTLHAEYAGMTKLKPEVKTPLDSGTVQSLDIVSLLVPKYVEMKYTMQLYADNNYSFLILEIKEGRLLGIDLAGEKVKIFIDRKNAIIYDCDLKTRSHYASAVAIPGKVVGDTMQASIIEDKDTAVIFFHKKVPRVIMGKVVTSGNEYGISQFRSSQDEFYLKSWEPVEFDFEKELQEARTVCIKKSSKTLSLIFPNK